MIHKDGTPCFANQAYAEIYGYDSPEDILGVKNIFQDIIAPDDRDRLNRYYECRMRGEPAPAHYDCRGIRRDGTMIWVENTITVVNWKGETAIQCSVIDITERKLLEVQLRQMQKMDAIGTLAGGIAHEFNNMLAGMLGFAQLASSEVPPASRASEYLQEVCTAGNRAKGLVQQVLAFSHPNPHDREPVQFSQVLQEALKFLRASLPTTIEIQQKILPESGMVLADATQLHQVLMNLCTNAEYAMRATGGTLEVVVDTVEMDVDFATHHPQAHQGRYMRLRVRDTGTGIPSETVERIFDPFFTTKGIGEGAGMGLAIVHGIVTSHGGVITVESMPGEGTTFTICLPRLVSEAETAGDRSHHVMPQGIGRILFVDDEAILVRLGQVLLTELGYEVTSYTSSLEALAAFRAAPDGFDVVITDQTMPNMTGEQLSRELRQYRPDIPIILCTGFGHVINAESAREQGIDAYCMKPVSAEEYTTTIQKVLERQPRIETSFIKKR